MTIVLTVDAINFLKECIVNGANHRFREFSTKYRNIGYAKKTKLGQITLLYSKACGFLPVFIIKYYCKLLT